MPLGCIYVQPSLCQGHWCTRTPMATLGTAGLLVYTYSVGLLLLFVSFVQAISYEPQIVKRVSNSAGLHAFFFVFTLL